MRVCVRLLSPGGAFPSFSGAPVALVPLRLGVSLRGRSAVCSSVLLWVGPGPCPAFAGTRTLVHSPLCRVVVSLFLGKSLGIELLGHGARSAFGFRLFLNCQARSPQRPVSPGSPPGRWPRLGVARPFPHPGCPGGSALGAPWFSLAFRW